MEEAYEVGIRLVLDDAVSPALTKIERQLAAFDAAAGARGQGLAGFARLPAPVVPALPAVAPLAEMPLPVSLPLLPMARPEAAVPPILAVPPLPAPAAPTLVAPVVLPAMPGLPAAPLEMSSLAPAPLLPAQPVPQAGAAAPVSFDFALFAPRPPPGEMLMPSAPVPPAGMAGPPPPITFAPLPEAPQAAPAAPGARPEVQVSAAATAAPQDMATPASPASALPQVAAGATIQLSGDVNLNGRSVGRWMSEEFTLMAEGPQAGTTFYDPRAGAAWPGTLQGA